MFPRQNRGLFLDPRRASLRSACKDDEVGTRGLALCAVAFLAIFGTQLAEATSSVIGTFRQQGSSNTFIPHAYVRSEVIDFGKDYPNSGSTHTALTFAPGSNVARGTGTTASGFYETTDKTTPGTATLTAPNSSQIKLVVEPSKFTWTKQSKTLPTVSTGNYWRAATYHKGIWAIMNDNGGVLSSNDGIEFVSQGNPLTNIDNRASPRWHGCLCGNCLDQILAISAKGRIAIGKVDAPSSQITWTPHESTLASDVTWYSLTYAKDKYVAASTQGNVATSSNGINWVMHAQPLRSISTDSWFGLAYDGKKFIATNHKGKIAVSLDGISWTLGGNSLTSIGSSSWFHARYGEECGIFATIQWTAPNHTAISRDGLKWIDQGTELESFNSRWDGCMTYGNGKFLAVSYGDVTAVGSYQGTIGFDGKSHEVSRQQTFYVTPTSGSITLNMTNIRLVSAELLGGSTSAKVPSIAFDTSFQSEVNRPRNEVVAAVDSSGLALLDEPKIVLPAESTISADFICNSASLDGKTALGVQANLSLQCETILSGDWSEYKNGSFETSGAGTLRIETAASLPQSDITIKDGGKLQFASGLEVTTGAGTILDLRGCSGISGGKSLTLGAGARLIF